MLDAIVTLLIIVEVLAALLLIAIILIQQTKAGGGLGAVAGGMTETMLGPSAGNVLTKATVILAAVFLGVTLLLAIITGQRRAHRSVIETLPGDAPMMDVSSMPAVEAESTGAEEAGLAAGAPAAEQPQAAPDAAAGDSPGTAVTVTAPEAGGAPPAAEAPADPAPQE